jgi:hypothetical protein
VRTIYLDVSAADDPNLAERLDLLADSGHRLILVGRAGDAIAGRSEWASRTDALPEAPTRGSWYLTSDPTTCRERQPGLRTVLIGPRVDGHGPTRCDTNVRDLREAVLEILAWEAMS